VYEISSKSDNFSLRYGDLTIFKMAVARHLGFYTFAFIVTRSPCQHAVLLPHTKFRWNPTIGWWVIAKKAIFNMSAAAILNFKNFNFGYVTVTGFSIWCSVPNFTKIGRFFTEIWRFNDFQNGGRPPSWILKICSFSHLAIVDMPFWFLIQNFAEIGQSVDKLWPKKRFSRFSKF